MDGIDLELTRSVFQPDATVDYGAMFEAGGSRDRTDPSYDVLDNPG